MASALGWGSVSAFSLVLGALLALARRWPERLVGLVLAFGAGALIGAVSCGRGRLGIGLAAGDAIGSASEMRG